MNKDRIRLIALDMDGTITQHRTPLEPENRAALDALSERYRLVIVGAGACRRIHGQLNGYPMDVIGNYGMEAGEYDREKGELVIVESQTVMVEPREAVLRRAAQPAASEEKKIIRVHDMEVNIVNRSVTLAGKEIRLTAKEFDLLQLFITNRGKVFSRETMLETVWKYDYMGDARTVDVHIRRLREKIERNTAQPEFIFTKWGVGYYFTDKD